MSKSSSGELPAQLVARRRCGPARRWRRRTPRAAPSGTRSRIASRLTATCESAEIKRELVIACLQVVRLLPSLEHTSYYHFVTSSDRRPIVTEDSAIFWDAAAQHRLVAQRCAECATLRHPPAPDVPALRLARGRGRRALGRGARSTATPRCTTRSTRRSSIRCSRRSSTSMKASGSCRTSSDIDPADDPHRHSASKSAFADDRRRGAPVPVFRPRRQRRGRPMS